LSNSKEIITKLFASYSDSNIDTIQSIAGAGSAREYFRIFFENKTAIVAIGNNTAENEAFLYFTEMFIQNGLNVPIILAVSDDRLSYMLSDVGTVSLLDFIESFKDNDSKVLDIYKKVLQRLLEIQIKVGPKLDYSRCLVRPKFDKQQLYFDLNYFKYYYLKLTELPFDEQLLEKEFTVFVDFIGESNEGYFLYRDFQARNIYIQDGEPYFIDYQGGMSGPLQYDVASLLYQSRAGLKEEIREQLLDFYISEAGKLLTINADAFKAKYFAIVLSRTLQTLGAYGFRGVIQKKELFLKSIPQSLQIMENIAQKVEGSIAIPYFISILKQLQTKSIISE